MEGPPEVAPAAPLEEAAKEASGGQAPHPLDDALDEHEDDDDEDDDDDDDDDDASSYTSASALEEEALYADQPACGLSPRLVVRRGVQTLLEADADAGHSPSSLHRVDTVLGFERAVGHPMPGSLVSPMAEPSSSSSSTLAMMPPALERITTLSGLPELADAEAALEAESSSTAKPTVVHRVDTMELLSDGDLIEDSMRSAAPEETTSGGGSSRPAKRAKVGEE